MLDLSQLQAEIERNEQADSSAIQLMRALAAEVEASKNDPVALQAFVDRLRLSTDALAAAVVTNTPSAPGPTPTPDPTPQP